jgi:hypothetical protein
VSKDNAVNVGNKENEYNCRKSLILDVLAPQKVHRFADDNSACKVERADEHADWKSGRFASIPAFFVLIAQLALFLELTSHFVAVALVNSS